MNSVIRLMGAACAISLAIAGCTEEPTGRGGAGITAVAGTTGVVAGMQPLPAGTQPVPAGTTGGAPISGTTGGAPISGTTGGTPPASGTTGGTPVASGDCDACSMSMCAAEVEAVEANADASALVACTQMAGCSDSCCLCGSACDPLGANYAMGPCDFEVETAAGVTPGAGALANGALVTDGCDQTLGQTTGCQIANLLGDCTAANCATECPVPACI